MKIRDIIRWRTKFAHNHGEHPETIPLTPSEITECYMDESPAMRCQFMLAPQPKIYGMGAEENIFAESLRERRLEMPLIKISETAEFRPELEMSQSQEIGRHLLRRLQTRICSTQTALELTFPDPWEKLKRKLRITRWFPLKPIKKKVLATVLYPYIKVPLPHNRHSVKFNEL